MLVAHVQAGGDVPAGVALPEDLADQGEPVIPDFPFNNLGRFLGINSGGLAYEAEAVESNADPDALAAVLVKRYPGLPRAYLEAVLVYTLCAAAKATPGQLYRVFIKPTEATLQDVKSGDLLPIWTDMKTEQYL